MPHTNTAVAPTPAHLPHKLAITMWDFSWYTRAGDPHSYADLNKCFLEAVERGYNSIRICAMPYLLFGEHDLPERASLQVTGMGNGYGTGVRWYHGEDNAEFDPLARLAELLDLAARHDCYVILTSWEYQQSPAFAAGPGWHQALEDVPVAERLTTLAICWNRMLDWLKATARVDRVAYVEIHNELEYSKFAARITAPSQTDLQRDQVEAAVAIVRDEHPDVLVTMCYAEPQVGQLEGLARNVQVAHVHAYVYGVLRALGDRLGVSDQSATPPNEALRAISRPDAVPFEEHLPDADWRLKATVLQRRQLYVFHSVDPDLFDLWLYDHYALYREAMREKLSLWIGLTAQWARSIGAPAVLGEGYVGYTPLYGGFEEGPVGKDIAEHAIGEAARNGFWGAVLCSNCAPGHPFWSDVSWQQRANARFLAVDTDQSGRAAPNCTSPSADVLQGQAQSQIEQPA